MRFRDVFDRIALKVDLATLPRNAWQSAFKRLFQTVVIAVAHLVLTLLSLSQSNIQIIPAPADTSAQFQPFFTVLHCALFPAAIPHVVDTPTWLHAACYRLTVSWLAIPMMLINSWLYALALVWIFSKIRSKTEQSHGEASHA